MSTEWTPEELEAVGGADELRISSVRPDGSLRPWVTIWTVRSGDELFVRSAYGPDTGWYRRAKASGIGRIRAGGIERDVSFAEADPGAHEGIDAAYEAKYGRYGKRIVQTVVGEQVHPLTIRLVPREV
jgi:hypothetical protein